MIGLGFVVITSWLACSGTDYTAQISEAQVMLEQGKFSEAETKFGAIIKEDPSQIDAATGAAYISMLKGDYTRAEDVLKGASATAAERAPELLLRRALVATYQKEYSTAQKFALESNLDMGKLLAAEVYLIDGEVEESEKLLKAISERAAKKLAKKYLLLLEDDNAWVQSYAEAQASWSLRDYELAVRSVGNILSKLDGKIDSFEEDVVIWASRAVAVGQVEIAQNLLSLNLSSLPDEHKWRIDAVKGMASFLDGDIIKGQKYFSAMEKRAPSLAVEHAKVTTAALLGRKDAQTSLDLLKGIEGTAAAQAFYVLGKEKYAQRVVDSGVFEQFLKGEL